MQSNSGPLVVVQFCLVRISLLQTLLVAGIWRLSYESVGCCNDDSGNPCQYTNISGTEGTRYQPIDIAISGTLIYICTNFHRSEIVSNITQFLPQHCESRVVDLRR